MVVTYFCDKKRCPQMWTLGLFYSIAQEKRHDLKKYKILLSGQIRYSIPEEMKKGSVIGNVAQDLGLDIKRLRSGRARIVTGDNVHYTELKIDKGILVVNERIDREELCGYTTPCSFSFEIILENPMELHPITIEVLDVNDHPPIFKKTRIMLDISESANLGARFVLDSAEDLDVGVNGLQNYVLTSNENFVLKQRVNPDGSKYAEMVIQRQLDREEVPHLTLKLIAVDGGNPQRSGTVRVHITVLDRTHVNVTNFKGGVVKRQPWVSVGGTREYRKTFPSSFLFFQTIFNYLDFFFPN
uniref:Cadherin domain-containing protein n=1 Tax=Amphilophus citrinellus TaxID=61819 RepID=A0A3Q0S3T0_AMPCI